MHLLCVLFLVEVRKGNKTDAAVFVPHKQMILHSMNSIAPVVEFDVQTLIFVALIVDFQSSVVVFLI